MRFMSSSVVSIGEGVCDEPEDGTILASASSHVDNRDIRINNRDLEEKLRWYRQSQNLGSKSYLVYTNKMLEDLVTIKPTSMHSLEEVKGFGSRRLERHGENLISIISSHITTNGGVVSSEPPLTNVPQTVNVEDIPFFTVADLKKHLKTRGQKMGGRKSELQSRLIHCLKKNKQGGSTGEGQGGGAGGATSQSPPIHMAPDLAPLTEEQKQVVDEIAGNQHTAFISGPAGSGKTHVLKHLTERFEKDGKKVAICAPTGAAAKNSDGLTVHNLLGLSPYDVQSLTTAGRKVLSNEAVRRRLEEMDVLIVDECSMMSRELLAVLEHCLGVGRRRSGEVAGGVKVIMVGDFFQLPPVDTNRVDQDQRWCFLEGVWGKLGLSDRANHHVLATVKRQEDTSFVDFLNKVRIGDISADDVEKFNDVIAEKGEVPRDGILPTRLFCTNKNVDKINSEELKNLPGEMATFDAYDTWTEELPPHSTIIASKLVASLSSEAKQKIHLKLGAQVMLSRNWKGEKNLVNGSRGVVVGFGGTKGVVVKFDNGLTRTVRRIEYLRSNPNGSGTVSRKQFPLKLAWATTIHKSQGSTLSRASLSINDAFDFGQAYVALSRVTGVEGLWLEEKMRAGMKWCEISPSVLKFYGLDEGEEGEGVDEGEEGEGACEREERKNIEKKEVEVTTSREKLRYASFDHFGTPVYIRNTNQDHFDIKEGEKDCTWQEERGIERRAHRATSRSTGFRKIPASRWSMDDESSDIREEEGQRNDAWY